jgi:hypothetical protein
MHHGSPLSENGWSAPRRVSVLSGVHCTPKRVRLSTRFILVTLIVKEDLWLVVIDLRMKEIPMRHLRSVLALLVVFPILVGATTLAQEKPEAFTFYATLSGDNVATPVETEGSGTVIAVLVGNDLTVTGVFQDLGSSLRSSGVSGVRMGIAPPRRGGPPGTAAGGTTDSRRPPGPGADRHR